ncbi:methyltransferase [Psychromonas sp. SP041]|uniref:methyltransferase n=1 Tax=Psychromonas sp. SP041 TaxID=1365007 RepID=UPI0010C79CA4|nr:methyltransferase [Psychromonas sp. SP041]
MLKHNFDKIDRYLTATKQYWHYNAFMLNDYPTFSGNSALINFLHRIDDNKLLNYQKNPASLYPLLKQFIPELLNINDPLFDINNNNLTHDLDMPFWLKKGIKGRKWIQIDRFSNSIDETLPVLEWCAGKGHLGRLIHYKTKNEISAVEWNAELCNQGLALAQQQSILQPFFVANVLLGEGNQLLNKEQHVVALHACGDLHVHLINGVKKALTEKVTISPCCYHLTEHDSYQAVSSYALQQSQLLSSITLSKQDLKLAVTQQSTSGERQTQLNDQEVWWRLSFDCLQKALLKTEDYLTVPSFPKTLLSNNFRDFAEWVKAYKQLDIELPADLSMYLVQGKVRFNRLRRGELVSQFFRRSLELWLVYDRALSLQEAGYQVNISIFCDANITPRNLLIQASR